MRPPLASSEADSCLEEAQPKGDKLRLLGAILAVAVAASRWFIVPSGIAHGLELGGELAAMTRMDPIIGLGRSYKDRRIGFAGFGQMIG